MNSCRFIQLWKHAPSQITPTSVCDFKRKEEIQEGKKKKSGEEKETIYYVVIYYETDLFFI